MKLEFHMFKKRHTEIDSQSVFEFFTDDHFSINTLDDLVELVYQDEHLDYQYKYIITKSNRVHNLYQLDSNFDTLHMSFEMNCLLPFYIVESIFKQTKKLCEKFGLRIYNDYFSDIKEFDYDELLSFWIMARETHLEELQLRGKSDTVYAVEASILYHVCKYQSEYLDLNRYYEGTINVFPYIILYNPTKNKVEFSVAYDWKQPNVFPPYLDYVHVVEEGNLPATIEYDTLLKYIGKYLHDVPGFIKGTKILRKEDAKKVRKVFKKIKPLLNQQSHLQKISVSQCIDEI